MKIEEEKKEKWWGEGMREKGREKTKKKERKNVKEQKKKGNE